MKQPAPVLTTQVVTPDGTVFSGPTVAVTATNATGKFSILPQHANFVTIISGKLTLHTSKKEAQEIDIENGVLACRENKVDVYVGIAANSK